MKRSMIAGLSILAVVTGVGLKLGSHQETSARLQDVTLSQHSEHSNPGSTNALSGIRIRLSPSDLGNEIRATAGQVPHIGLAAD